MPPDSTGETDQYDVITMFATAEIDPDERPELAAALQESRTQVTSQTGYLMRFGDATHRDLTVFDVVSLPIQSYPVSESAFASLPARVRERLADVGGVQIVAKYDPDEGVFQDVAWLDDNSPGQPAVADGEVTDLVMTDETSAVDRRNTGKESTTQAYRQIMRGEFEAFLDELDLEFTRKEYAWTNEWVYEALLDDGEKCLRVYSSIDREDNASREAGTDAIKSVLLINVADEGTDPRWKPLRESKRTYRIQTWRENLRKKLERAVATKDEVKVCPECESPMVVQTTKDGDRQFWGCSRYYETASDGDRECTHTEPLR